MDLLDGQHVISEMGSVEARRETLRLARAEHRRGYPEEAQELYHRAMADDPLNPEVYYGLGQLAQQIGCSALASHYFSLAAELALSNAPKDRGGEGDNTISDPQVASG